MGNKLVTQPENPSVFLNCNTDTDCFAANANMGISEATT